MAEYTQPVIVIHEVRCSSCDRHEQTGKVVWTLDGMRDHIAGLVATGWRVYAGRTRRHYCPDCSPCPGHKMRLVAGTEAVQ